MVVAVYLFFVLCFVALFGSFVGLHIYVKKHLEKTAPRL